MEKLLGPHDKMMTRSLEEFIGLRHRGCHNYTFKKCISLPKYVCIYGDNRDPTVFILY